MFYGQPSNVCSNQHHTDQSPCRDRLHRSPPYALGASAPLLINHSLHSSTPCCSVPSIGLVDARPVFSCPLLRNFPAVAVCPIPTRILINVFTIAQPSHGVLLLPTGSF